MCESFLRVQSVTVTFGIPSDNLSSTLVDHTFSSHWMQDECGVLNASICKDSSFLGKIITNNKLKVKLCVVLALIRMAFLNSIATIFSNMPHCYIGQSLS